MSHFQLTVLSYPSLSRFLRNALKIDEDLFYRTIIHGVTCDYPHIIALRSEKVESSTVSAKGDAQRPELIDVGPYRACQLPWDQWVSYLCIHSGYSLEQHHHLVVYSIRISSGTRGHYGQVRGCTGSYAYLGITSLEAPGVMIVSTGSTNVSYGIQILFLGMWDGGKLMFSMIFD